MWHAEEGRKMNFGKKIPTRDGFGDEIVALGKENRKSQGPEVGRCLVPG